VDANGYHERLQHIDEAPRILETVGTAIKIAAAVLPK